MSDYKIKIIDYDHGFEVQTVLFGLGVTWNMNNPYMISECDYALQITLNHCGKKRIHLLSEKFYNSNSGKEVTLEWLKDRLVEYNKNLEKIRPSKLVPVDILRRVLSHLITNQGYDELGELLNEDIKDLELILDIKKE